MGNVEHNTLLTPAFTSIDLILEAIALPAFCKNNSGHFIHFNNRFCDFLGYSREQIINRISDDIIRHQDAAMFQSHDSELLNRSITEKAYEATYRSPVGDCVFIQISKKILTDENDHIIGILGTIVDLTNGHMAQNEIDQQKHLLKERIKEFSCIVEISHFLERLHEDHDGTFSMVAARIPDGWTYPQQTSAEIEIDHRCFRSGLVDRNNSQLSEPVIVNGVDRGKVTVFRRPVIKDHSPPYLSEEKLLLSQIAHEISLALARIDHSRILTEQTTRLATTFNQAAVGICHVDPKGNIFKSNAKFCDILGYPNDELTTLSFQDLTHPDDLALSIEKLRLALDGKNDEYSLEKRYFTKSGSTIWCRTSVSVVRNADQTPNYFICIIQDITDRKHAEIRIQQLKDKTNKALRSTIKTLSLAIEARDPYTAGHQSQVEIIAEAIGRKLGLPDEIIDGLRIGASIHDIGKIAIPSQLLNRPGKLSAEELSLIKTHPTRGYCIMKDIDLPWPIADMVIQHHEKLDGTGYPHGLKGDQILIQSRIIAVADAVEAITSHRPYRASLGLDQAIKILQDGRGSAYDSTVVDACNELISEGGVFWEAPRCPIN